MKFALMGLALITASAFAQSNPNDCFKVKNNLDRRYCVDKYLETVKDKNAAEKKVWDAAGMTAADKTNKSGAIESDIQMKRDQIALLQSEITIAEKHLSDVKAAKENASAAPVEHKKKKKKGFRIKL